MGEARTRQTFSQRIREEQPFCIFCGGDTPSETVEHYPPRIMFDGKHRPKGLEFGACKACNDGSREADFIAAFFARMHSTSDTELAREETRRIITRAAKIPGFAEEVYPEENQSGVLVGLGRAAFSLPSWNFIRTHPGPLLQSAMQTFGCKLGLALHSAHTGNIVPTAGAVAAFWYSNVDAYSGRLPEEFLRLLGPGRTLQQGNFEVSRQFRVSSITDGQGKVTGHFAVFRESFGVLMFVVTDARLMKFPEAAQSPGFLRRKRSSNGDAPG